MADTDDRKLALDHAWAWFTLHASQRMQFVNFWLVAVAFLTTGVATALSDDKPQVACFIALAGAVATICFHRLERRTRGLIKVGEAALKHFERDLADSADLQELKMVQRADDECGEHFSSYGDVIRALHYFATVCFLAGAAYSGWRWSQ